MSLLTQARLALVALFTFLDKHKPLDRPKVKGFLFVYFLFLDLLIKMTSSTNLVAKPIKAVINTITVVQKTIVEYYPLL